MFNKVLIANRGEIAVRIIRACRELGLGTVAVFSEADRSALHVRYANEAFLLGPSPSSESYLRGDKIIDIAKKSGAGAIHPGYGFLAERSDFAQDVIDAGLAFIGPKPSSIAAMGDKGIARKTVSSAGIPVVPGTEGDGALKDDELLAVAPDVGFPLLIKATAGGGGKGMRVVNNIEEMPSLLLAARREAESSFGDGNVYLEKLIEGARHIEIQILADAHGNVVHLGERECSLQRRHQKLLEESPSPFIGDDEELRQRMGAVAVRAAQSVEYVNAGTIDLSFTQEDVRMTGWAIECRVNAEDAHNHFMPSTGRIAHMQLPTGPGVRVDTGVYPGFEISPYYDSLISKLIVYGSTRAEAILRMRRALEEYRLVGVRTNIPFHQNMMDSHRFMAGQFDTQFVEKRFSMERANQYRERNPQVAAIMATLVAHTQTQRSAHIIRRSKRDTSNWKWLGRWERMHR
jgi:acetyl/propionyl-CoA carboxylase alpha subunit